MMRGTLREGRGPVQPRRGSLWALRGVPRTGREPQRAIRGSPRPARRRQWTSHSPCHPPPAWSGTSPNCRLHWTGGREPQVLWTWGRRSIGRSFPTIIASPTSTRRWATRLSVTLDGRATGRGIRRCRRLANPRRTFGRTLRESRTRPRSPRRGRRVVYASCPGR